MCRAACRASTAFDPDAHAAADVEQQRELDRAVRLGAEIENRPRLPGFGDDEVRSAQIGHEAAFAVADHRTDRDDVDRRSGTSDGAPWA